MLDVNKRLMKTIRDPVHSPDPVHGFYDPLNTYVDISWAFFSHTAGHVTYTQKLKTRFTITQKQDWQPVGG